MGAEEGERGMLFESSWHGGQPYGEKVSFRKSGKAQILGKVYLGSSQHPKDRREETVMPFWRLVWTALGGRSSHYLVSMA